MESVRGLCKSAAKQGTSSFGCTCMIHRGVPYRLDPHVRPAGTGRLLGERRQACHAVRPDESRRLALDEVFSPPNRHGFEAGMDVERPQYVADVVPHRLRAEV